jgi:hypothetical protein
MIIETTEVKQYSYTCSKCNYSWFSNKRNTNPKCPVCSKIEVSFEVTDYTPFTLNENKACIHCNNNPKNGGSGFCLCTLGESVLY